MHRDLSRFWKSGATVVLLALCSVIPASAGYSSWTSQGPEGGYVLSLVAAGSSPALFAGVRGDVMRSLDGGWTWSPASRGLSRLKGIPWDFYLAADPTNPDTLYTGSIDGVYKTTDAGATWARLGKPGDISFVGSVAVSPAAPRTIWAMSTTSSGLHVSRDAGATWSHVEGGGFPAGGQGQGHGAWLILPHPTRAGVIYICTPHGLYKSTDDGAHWKRILDAWSPVALDPVHPQRLYAWSSRSGLVRSVDGGHSWRQLASPSGTDIVCALGVDPRTSAVYMAMASGSEALRIYKSMDGGTTWTEGERSPYAAWALTFGFDPRQPSAVFLGLYAGVWKSTDRGRIWRSASHGLANLSVEAIAIDPSNPRFVYASSYFSGVYRSADRGETWTSRSTGPEVWYVNALLVAPFEPATLFAGTERGLSRSTDRALTWSDLNGPGMVFSLAAEPVPPYTLYAGTREGLFRSTDRGETWSMSWSGEVNRVAVSPARPSNVFITTTSGLYFSADRGERWVSRPFSFGSPFLIAVDPSRPSLLYVSANPHQTGGPTLFKSVDAGLTWRPASTGLPSSWILDLVIDPAQPSTLYAAVSSSVFWARDGGETWTPLTEDLPSPAQALALDPTGASTLHAATFAHGVFELTRLTPPPPGDFLTADAFPGFRFKVLITAPGRPGVVGRQEINCIPRALCVSGRVRHRTDVLLRVDRPQPDGSFSMTVARFTHAQVEVWAERPATGDKRYYRLAALPAGMSDQAALNETFSFPGF